MIISASRRTDIPAFYAEWFIKRIRAGFCTVPNPFNPKQVTTVSLKPEDVDVIVFWTRNPRPLLPYLHELDECGNRYYFQYTILNNPRSIDPKTPSLETALQTFQELARAIGSQRLIWRYDPIVFSEATSPAFHLENYQKIARALHESTQRSVISIMDDYPKIHKRLESMAEQGARLLTSQPASEAWFAETMIRLAQIASQYGMEITSCAEELNLALYGIQPGKCVDDRIIRKIFGIEVGPTKDPSQRAACGCVTSKDIGMYDTCLYGCSYCYATSNFANARRRYARHNPDAPSLLSPA